MNQLTRKPRKAHKLRVQNRWVTLGLGLFWVLLFSSCAANSSERVVDYVVTISDTRDTASVEIRVPNNHWLRQLSIQLKHRRIQDAATTSGELVQGERLEWRPGQGNAVLRYSVAINEPDPQGRVKRFRAVHTDEWMIMRLDDLFPPFRARFKKGEKAKTQLIIKSPSKWKAYTGYSREGDVFVVESDNMVSRPTGWMIAGEPLVARHDRYGPTYLSVVGPANHTVRAMELLSFSGIALGYLQKIFKHSPQKVLVVSSGDPMWRGGLSAPNALFIHASRPLVSENGTSTLLHEWFHVVSGIRSEAGHDWITEGLAEYYSVKILAITGAITGARMSAITQHWQTRGKSVKKLITSHASGEVTAKAAALFSTLDREIQSETEGKMSLDQVVAGLQAHKNLNFELLSLAVKNVLGKPSSVLRQAAESI